MPARMSADEEAHWIQVMVDRLARRNRRGLSSDSDLSRRAAELSLRHLDGLAVAETVRWVDNQRTRWGSCTVVDRSIRLSTRLQGMPDWVVDYVLVHELAHLLVPTHGSQFWAWVDRYPRTERARGYLEGVAATAKLQLDDEADVH
jgi:predicted metal-dependent hydrolase